MRPYIITFYQKYVTSVSTFSQGFAFNPFFIFDHYLLDHHSTIVVTANIEQVGNDFKLELRLL